MDLSTQYLGLDLGNPFVPSSSPLSRDVDKAKRLEDHGAGALVMYSLFEEECEEDQAIQDHLMRHQDIGHGEASSYLPVHHAYLSKQDAYLEQLARLKGSLDIPVIASLNGISVGGWIEHAHELEQAGADAIELNVYYAAADVEQPAAAVETRYVEILDALNKQVKCPIGMKLSPQFSSVGHFVRRLEQAGARGVALFNRFYQPDIDLQSLELSQSLHLSTSSDSLLAMRWIAILHGRVGLSLGATGGVHTWQDAVKMLLVGADVTYLCSTLLRNGPDQLDSIRQGTLAWMQEHEYESVRQLKGSLSQQRSPDPVAYERGNYVSLLDSYKIPASVWR